MGAAACMAETLRHRVGGHKASLDEDGGRRKERLRECKAARGRRLFYPSSKAADTCQGTLNPFHV
jgi:hypothetical protein